MPATSNGHLEVFRSIDGHEERILRVEDSLQRVSSQVAEIAAKQDYHAQAMEEAHARITQAIERGFTEIKSDQAKVSAKIESTEDMFETQIGRLEPLERAKEASDARAGLFKKIMLSGLIAAAGVIGTKLVEFLSAAR